MKIPLTQSKAWQKLQNDLGEVSFFEEGSGYQYLAILKTTPVGNYLYLPYGPAVEDKNGLENALKSLKLLAKRKDAMFIRIEPTDPDLARSLPNNTKKSTDLNPQMTWRLNLKDEDQTIILNFSHGVRNAFNTFEKKGLKVEKTKQIEDITHLVKLQEKLYKEKKINAFSKSYLEAELHQPFATLYLVKYLDPEKKSEQVLAASLFFDYDKTRYYMQSASDNDYKKLPATVALLTTAIFDAKKAGLQYFDFWGIAPDDAPSSHPWKGFTKFKKSFGGEEVVYAGTYDIVLKPLKYRFYHLTRKLNRFLRHL